MCVDDLDPYQLFFLCSVDPGAFPSHQWDRAVSEVVVNITGKTNSMPQ